MGESLTSILSELEFFEDFNLSFFNNIQTKQFVNTILLYLSNFKTTNFKSDLFLFDRAVSQIDRFIINENSQLKGVSFLSVFKAKGLEFEHVFMPNLQKSHWDRAADYNYVDRILRYSNESSIEDYRRMFYVAATRSSNDVYLTCFDINSSGRGIQRSQFFDELASILL